VTPPTGGGGATEGKSNPISNTCKKIGQLKEQRILEGEGKSVKSKEQNASREKRKKKTKEGETGVRGFQYASKKRRDKARRKVSTFGWYVCVETESTGFSGGGSKPRLEEKGKRLDNFLKRKKGRTVSPMGTFQSWKTGKENRRPERSGPAN